MRWKEPAATFPFQPRSARTGRDLAVITRRENTFFLIVRRKVLKAEEVFATTAKRWTREKKTNQRITLFSVCLGASFRSSRAMANSGLRCRGLRIRPPVIYRARWRYPPKPARFDRIVVTRKLARTKIKCGRNRRCGFWWYCLVLSLCTGRQVQPV